MSRVSLPPEETAATGLRLRGRYGATGLAIYLCMYLHIYIYIYVYIYTHAYYITSITHTILNMYMCMYIYIYTHMHVFPGEPCLLSAFATLLFAS